MTQPPDPTRELAVVAGRRMVARGERPSYHVQSLAGGMTARVRELELVVDVPESMSVLRAAREAIAVVLEVPPGAFEVVLEARR